MSNVNLFGNFESLRRTKFPPLSLPFILRIFATVFIKMTTAATRRWRRGVVDAFRFAVLGGEHVHLTEVRDLYHYGVVVLGKRLLPRLPINPHECVVCCAFVELETNPMRLQQANTFALLCNTTTQNNENYRYEIQSANSNSRG